jgi:hypothetical protein
MMNWKWFGNKRPWSDLMYNTGIFLEALKKAMENSFRIAGLRAKI